MLVASSANSIPKRPGFSTGEARGAAAPVRIGEMRRFFGARLPGALKQRRFSWHPSEIKRTAGPVGWVRRMKWVIR